jgi:pimeloyl-ACP methyl ester carboxylesterase
LTTAATAGRSCSCTDDVEAWIEALGLAPVMLIGQSLGAHTRF